MSWEYNGELDEGDRMCGTGTLRYKIRNPKYGDKTPSELGYNDYTGTFYNDLFHGEGKQDWEGYVYHGEYKEGSRHGKSTVYATNGDVFNAKWREGEQLFMKKVEGKVKAWYGSGQPIR